MVTLAGTALLRMAKLKGSLTVLKPSARIFCTPVAKSLSAVLSPCTSRASVSRAKLWGHCAELCK